MCPSSFCRGGPCNFFLVGTALGLCEGPETPLVGGGAGPGLSPQPGPDLLPSGPRVSCSVLIAMQRGAGWGTPSSAASEGSDTTGSSSTSTGSVLHGAWGTCQSLTKTSSEPRGCSPPPGPCCRWPGPPNNSPSHCYATPSWRSWRRRHPGLAEDGPGGSHPDWRPPGLHQAGEGRPRRAGPAHG